MTSLPPPTTAESASETPITPDNKSWSIQRIGVVSAGVLGGIITVIFVIGLALALLSDAEATAARMEIIKNTFIIIMTLEALLIVAALGILIVQVARLINLLQSKTRPVLDNAQEAVNSAKGTVEFVGDNVTEPLIRTGAFLAGARVFLRDVGGIRRAIRRNGTGNPDDE
jgi:hypothetical protein